MTRHQDFWRILGHMWCLMAHWPFWHRVVTVYDSKRLNGPAKLIECTKCDHVWAEPDR